MKIPEELHPYLAYVAEHKVLGYTSMMDFAADAVRSRVRELVLMKLIPTPLAPVKKVPRQLVGR